MLAPPPEGTFDIVDENHPVKNLSKDSFQCQVKDNSPEQVPLLNEDAVSTDPKTPKNGKVITYLAWH